ncbi:MAG: serine hydrolase domain-containing protein [Bacteroidota bacterium]
MRKYLLFLPLVLLIGWSTSCKNVSTAPPAATAANTDWYGQLKLLLQEAVDDAQGTVPGVSAAVIDRDKDILWEDAVGFADLNETIPLSSDYAFRIASVTKTFVAAAILRLHELDSLDIYESISDHISEAHRELLIADGYQPDNITLLHCLQHTSGLYDYAVGSPAYLETLSKNPARQWSRTDQLRFAMDLGDPLWPPGEGFYYSDTGYILLGEAIERAVDSTLAYGLRSLLKFEDLYLENTWLETVEPRPAVVQDQVVRRYFQRQDYTEWDASIDLWGGGGLMATTGDIARFVHALFAGDVFDQPATLALMLAPPDPFPDSYQAEGNPRHMDYRAGLHAIELYGKTVYSHSGFWGTGFLYLPEHKATIAVNYTAGYKERLMKKIAHLLTQE